MTPSGASLTSTAPRKENPYSNLHKPPDTPAKVPLDDPLFHGIIDGIENSIWSAAACCRFSFFEGHFFRVGSTCSTGNIPIRINHLQNAHFVSLFLCYSCIIVG